MARLRIAGKLSVDDDTWIGEPERVAVFISRQSSYELSVLAIRELYKCLSYRQTTKNLAMVDDLTQTWAVNEDIDLSEEFKRSASQKDITELDHPYTQYAFIGFRDVPAFFSRFDNNLSIAKKRKDEKRSVSAGKRNKGIHAETSW